MTRIDRSSDLREVAFAVCTALEKAGVTAVLTGGSAATVYAPHDYQSLDIDFVITFQPSKAKAEQALENLGYARSGQHYVHAENPLFLEFPPGPLTVGRDLIRSWATLKEKHSLLHILNPTDCCRDRLAGFVFWNDRNSLEQAILVAKATRRRVNLRAIRDWCEREGHQESFLEFERRLNAAKTDDS